MTDIHLINSKFTIPTTLTAATILIAAFSDYNQLPVENHTIIQYQIKNKVWEEQYIPYKFSINDSVDLFDFLYFDHNILT